MKTEIYKVSGVMTLCILAGCNTGQSTAVNSANSAQLAAAEISKEFKAMDEKANKAAAKQPKTGIKPAPASAGLTGVPKGAVEGAKSVVDKTKEMASKAKEMISNAVNSNPAEVEKNAANNVAKNASSTLNKQAMGDMGSSNAVTEAPSTQDAAKSQAPQKPAEKDTAKNGPSITPEKGQDKGTESAGVAGLPKSVVESAKSVADDTKEMASKVGEVIANAVDTNPPSQPNEKSSADKGKMAESSHNNMNKSATNAQSAQSIAESQAPKVASANEQAKNSQPTNQGSTQKSDIDTTGVAGLPKNAVEGVKSIINDTKDLASKAADSMTN